MPRTSVIIPTHDRPQLLKQAVESARQAGADIEIVVVDDGSTDDTRAVCASLPGIVYQRLDRQHGVGGARAAGISASTGKYVALLDDDDVRLPGSIDRQVAVLESSPRAGLVYGQTYLGSQNLAVHGDVFPKHCLSGDVFWSMIEHNFMASCTVIARRSVVDEVGGLHPESAPADDWDLWLRITERHPVEAVPEPVAIYRQPTLWSKQGSSRVADGLVAADLRVLERLASLLRVQADPRSFQRARRRLKRALCNRLLAEAVVATRHGDPYAFVSVTKALSTMFLSFLLALTSPANWRKLPHALASAARPRRPR